MIPTSVGKAVTVASQLVRSLEVSAGLTPTAAQDEGGKEQGTSPVLARYTSAVGEDGRVDFLALCPAPSTASSSSSLSSSSVSGRIVNLEICSGAGDWATSQARQDAAALWITLELRRDRVQQTFASMVLKGVSNMCVVGGDAHCVLRDRFRSGTVDNIFVNHPEPPERNSGTSGSEGAHLLTAPFFNIMRGALKPGGRITIVTDNLPYGKSLVQIAHSVTTTTSVVGAAAAAGVTEFGVDGGGAAGAADVVAAAGQVCLFEGTPGPGHGYKTDTTSYFDRMWQQGGKSRRFFLSVTREELS